jgi:quinoprotein glucose dehydrogenase
VRPPSRTFWITLSFACASALSSYGQTWSVYHGSNEATKYSDCTQINRDNVQKLEVAWVYRSGDRAAGDTQGALEARRLSRLQTNPIIIVALDAATGRERWVHRSSAPGRSALRGLMYWESPDRSDCRVFFTVGTHLLALDAKTGRPIPSFGQDGSVTLYVDRDSARTAAAPSPGIVFEDLIIMGSVVGEMYGGAPGNIRAYDARTGGLRWVFRTIPRPGEYGFETWPKEAWRYSGGANVWGAFSLDVKRGLVFAPTGSPSYDFYGADRKGQNLFGNCVIALDARTGERRWHFQVVHHDLWDYDLSAQPLLATLRRDGKPVDAVVQVTKHGFVFVLDRDTGTPLFPVEERPVPKSDVPGEEAWPTQPFPLKPAPVSRQHLTVDDLTTFPSPEEQQAIREKFLSARHEGLFTPPSTRGTVVSPGHNGGPLWGGGAFDPSTGILYVSSHDQPSYFKLSPVSNQTPTTPLARGRQIYRNTCATCHGTTGAGAKEILAFAATPDRNPQSTDLPAQSLTASLAQMTARSFADIVRHGRNRMPATPNLSDTEIELLYDYVRQIETPLAQQAEPFGSDAELRFTTPWAFFRDSSDLPFTKPPWGKLTAIDLNTGETLWETLHGDEKAIAARGLPATGHKYLKGGPVVTAGGLIFMAGTDDRRIRAYDSKTGALLWTGELPFSSAAIPAIYELAGRQFVVITAMADRGDDPGDAVVAFALPRE